jgi:hypothetical protein
MSEIGKNYLNFGLKKLMMSSMQKTLRLNPSNKAPFS